MTVRHRKVSAHLKLVENLDSEITALAESLATPTTGRKGPKDSDILPPDDAFSFNDLGNADRFLQFAGDDPLYCVEREKWLVWQGTHWQFDEGDFVFELAAEFTRSMFLGIIYKEQLQNATRANNAAGFNAILNLAARRKSVSIARFDADPYVVNCKNGTLDLRTGDFRRICVSADSGRSSQDRDIGKESG